MLFTDIEIEDVNKGALSFNASWNPDDDMPVESDWDDEDDEDFDDRVADLEDLHQIELEEELGEPDPDDDDHLPDDDDE